MPKSRTNPARQHKARQYGAIDAVYRARLRQWQQEQALGYEYPETPPSKPRSKSRRVGARHCPS